MKENRLVIKINKPINFLFSFTTTPPNSTLWIPGVVKEETSEWPIIVGTIYRLQDKNGNISNVTVNKVKNDEFIEWISEDKNYHCRYSFKTIDQNSSELEYFEWVDSGEITEPFTQEVLKKLKSVIEKK